MKMINKNYFRYLIRQNKRYLLLIWLISFILTPFLTINFLNNGNGENFGQIVVITSMFGFLISFVVPIYLFTFLQKKKSNILYFSLPIKKRIIIYNDIMFCDIQYDCSGYRQLSYCYHDQKLLFTGLFRQSAVLSDTYDNLYVMHGISDYCYCFTVSEPFRQLFSQPCLYACPFSDLWML